MCAELFDDNGKLMKDSYNQQVVVVFLGLAISRKPLSATAGGCYGISRSTEMLPLTALPAC